MTTGLRHAFAALLLIALWLTPALAAWDLDALEAALSTTAGGPERVAFHEERQSAFLDAPVVVTGYLLRQGGRLEKHVTAPVRESFIIAGGTVTVRAAGEAELRVSLRDHPILAALATALRATLQGDLDRLQRNFDVSLEGTAEAWRLRLFPQTEAQRDALEEVTLHGAAGVISAIHLMEPGDATTVITLHRQVE